VGLLCGGFAVLIEINLLPWRRLQRRYQLKKGVFFGVGALLVCGGILFVINRHVQELIDQQMHRNERLQQEVMVLNQQCDAIKKMVAIKKTLVAYIDTIQGLQSDRLLTGELLDELAHIIPDGIYFKQVQWVGEQMVIFGRARSNTNISIMMRNIELNPCFHTPVLAEITKNNASSFAYQFKLTVHVNQLNKQ
jgi:type IV pilus assembly protein PilN